MALALHPVGFHDLEHWAAGHLKEMAARVTNAFRLWHQRLASRRELMRLDDHLLADIGLTRADAWREANKPFWDA
jgi:uncharacterized protein YjiS (DUF1127 family)